MRKKILFLVPYPAGIAPSQRFRFEQYLDKLPENNFDYDVRPFIESKSDYHLFFGGNGFTILRIIMGGVLRRVSNLFLAHGYDYIFIHREAMPIGPPIFEFILARILGKRIIFDFDDAIWLTDRVDEGAFRKMMKWRSKVAKICRWSFRISCGNKYLCDYALKYNGQAIINPTTIDAEAVNYIREGGKDKPTVNLGWTGSHSTLKYLKLVEPVLQELEKRYSSVQTIVIADKSPDLSLCRMTFVQWHAGSEISDLSKIDIGIMPLPDDEWTRGKCGFKALQYMALGIPTVVSPVGVNQDIVREGVNGFVARTNAEWVEILSRLVEDDKLREKIGSEGKRTVLLNYSTASNLSNFLSLFG